MRLKAIQDLSQLSDDFFFTEVAAGAALCVLNAKTIHADALKLDKLNRPAGTEILRQSAEEEAAKVLILLDAVRCPRIARQTEFSRQLGYFNEHLAKGIYARYSWRKPHSFLEVREWVDRERKEYYLDGPNGIDWIFYNEILRRREEAMYVDYVENDNEHTWHDPRRMDELGATFANPRNPTLLLVSALSDAGLLQADALRIIAETWRGQSIEDAATTDTVFELNNQTLSKLHDAGLLLSDERETIHERWLFPLYPLDLRRDPVKKDDLREVRRNWSPYGD